MTATQYQHRQLSAWVAIYRGYDPPERVQFRRELERQFGAYDVRELFGHFDRVDADEQRRRAQEKAELKAEVRAEVMQQIKADIAKQMPAAPMPYFQQQDSAGQEIRRGAFGFGLVAVCVGGMVYFISQAGLTTVLVVAGVVFVLSQVKLGGNSKQDESASPAPSGNPTYIVNIVQNGTGNFQQQ